MAPHGPYYAHIMTIIQWLFGSLGWLPSTSSQPGGIISKVKSWDLIDEDPGELKDAPLEAYYYGAQAAGPPFRVDFQMICFGQKSLEKRNFFSFPLKVLGPHPCTYGLGPEEMMLEVLKRHVHGCNASSVSPGGKHPWDWSGWGLRVLCLSMCGHVKIIKHLHVNTSLCFFSMPRFVLNEANR